MVVNIIKHRAPHIVLTQRSYRRISCWYTLYVKKAETVLILVFVIVLDLLYKLQ